MIASNDRSLWRHDPTEVVSANFAEFFTEFDGDLVCEESALREKFNHLIIIQ
jgi:hypothetical protein